MKITVKYPESWKDISYMQYLKYYKMLKPYEGTDTYNKKNLELGALCFCNVPTEALYKLPKETFDKVVNAVSNLVDSSKQILVQSFEVENIKHGFIPSLDEISYGEYLDLVEYFKNPVENAPILMSILYRPITKQIGDSYIIESYSGTSDKKIELFKHILTMDVVFGATSFFLDLLTDLLNATLSYSMMLLKKMKNPEALIVLQDLQKNGVDITQLPSLLKMILQNLTRLPNFQSTNA